MSEIVKTFEASEMTAKFHLIYSFSPGKRKQQDDSSSESQAKKSATRTMSANSTSGTALSTSLIASGLFADNFSELEDKYDNQLMGKMAAEDVYRWLRMRGMESIVSIPARIYLKDLLDDVSDLSTRKQESSSAPGNDL
jgi:hypothetical protein